MLLRMSRVLGALEKEAALPTSLLPAARDIGLGISGARRAAGIAGKGLGFLGKHPTGAMATAGGALGVSHIANKMRQATRGLKAGASGRKMIRRA